MRIFTHEPLSRPRGHGATAARLAAGRPGGLKSLLRSSSLAVGARVAGAVLGICAQILLARILSAEDLGNFFVALSLATVLATVSTLGYPWIVPMILARADAAGRPHRAAAFLAWARRDIGVVSAGLAVVAILGIWLVPSFSIHTRWVLTAGAATAPVFALMRFNGPVANARRKFALGYLPDLFWRPLFLLGLIVALWALFGRFDVTGLLLGHLAITIALAAEMARRLNAADGTGDGVATAPGRLGPGRRGQGRRWRARALPMVVATLFIGVFADLDLLIAGSILNETETGIFGVCIKISMFLAFSIQAVHQVMVRDVANALQSRDRSALTAILFKANQTNLLVSLGAVAGVYWLARHFLALFGPEFVDGGLSLLLLAAAQAIRAAAGPATQILALTGHVRATLPVFAAGLALLFATNLALVPLYGLTGAALAVLIVTAVWSMGLSLLAKARTGLDVAIFRLPQLSALSGAKVGGSVQGGR
ncbi:MAG: polysaccharide biosynthesis C-terminal domain-containing protein [Hyphomicrobiales bacterium]|nr:polysaccharide biosynthesis C-terminal domain-containing protein [Hyphomicrobiales bacterium]